MAINFSCGACAKGLLANDECAGMRFTCPACGQTIVAPYPVARNPRQSLGLTSESPPPLPAPAGTAKPRSFNLNPLWITVAVLNLCIICTAIYLAWLFRATEPRPPALTTLTPIETREPATAQRRRGRRSSSQACRRRKRRRLQPETS